MSLLPEIVDTMAKSDIPIFAAGGIVDDGGVAVSLSRGEYRWPEDHVPRTIINKWFIEFRQARPFEELRELWQEAGDEEGLVRA